MRADKEGVELFSTQKTSSEWRNTHKTFELVSNFSVATTKAVQYWTIDFKFWIKTIIRSSDL